MIVYLFIIYTYTNIVSSNPTVISANVTTLYSSNPCNITIKGTNFYNTTSICNIGSTSFSAVYINANTTVCQYTSLMPGNYSLSLIFNNTNPIGSIAMLVLQSYLFSSVVPSSLYIPAALNITGFALDGNLYCNFTGVRVKSVYINSSKVICNIPSSVSGNFSMWMQDPYNTVVSGVYYIISYSQVQLLFAASPCTGSLLAIEYTGFISETVYCNVGGSLFNASFSTKIITCDIGNLSEGDYYVFVQDLLVQVSYNSIFFSRRLNVFDAGFTLQTDLIITLNTTFSVPSLYCKWGHNAPLVIDVTDTNYVCQVTSIKDRGTWCMELSYDGINFSNQCLYQYTHFRTSNFLYVQPSELLLNGSELQIYSNKLYNTTYQCLFDQGPANAIVNNNYISCLAPSLDSPGESLFNISQDGSAINEFTLRYMEPIEILNTFPMFLSEQTTNLYVFGTGFYQGVNCTIIGIKSNCVYNNISSVACEVYQATQESNTSCYNIDGSLSNIYTIGFRALAGVNQTTPSTLFEGIQNLLFITGFGFYSDSTVKINCEEDFILNATYIDSDLISISTYMDYCNIFGEVFLSVSSNFIDFSAPVQLSIYPVPNLYYLSFYSSPYIGGDTLTFIGNGFIGQLYCNFGGILVNAYITSYNEGNCTTPFAQPGTVLFSLKIIGLEYTSGYKNYTFDPLANFTITPNIGRDTDTTLISIIGSFDIILENVMCIINNQQILANINDGITCSIPPGTGKLIVKVSISNKLYSSYIPVYFSYVSYPTLAALSVNSGPSIGNTPVLISGKGFSYIYGWECVFGSYTSEAIYMNSTIMLCYSPSQPPVTNIGVSLTLNNQSFTNSLLYSYYYDSSINYITPATGPSTGSTAVSFSGKFLSSVTYCKIGWIVVKIVNSICLTPPWWYGPVAIELTSNGIDYTKSNVSFYYYNDFQVFSLLPRTIPNTGGTVYMNTINPPSNLSCSFNSIQVPVTYAGNVLGCNVPSIFQTNQLIIQLTANNQNYITFSDTTSISIYTPPALVTISQSIGVAGSYINVTGTGFINSYYFQARLGNTTYYRFLSSNSIIIKVPNIISGVYSLQVSNNNQDMGSITNITVSDRMQVINVWPLLSSIKGGTVFNARVNNAINSTLLTCMFAMEYQISMGLYYNYKVPGIYYNSTHIQCVSPAISYPGIGYLAVSSDNQTYSVSNTSIEFIDTCKDRVVCIGNSILACPAGFYCLERFWYTPVQCPAGSYQNLTSQVSCIPCPSGQICNTTIAPSACPSNYTCSTPGLVYPDFVCPNGYYCDVNTTVPKKLCGFGLYCNGVENSCTDGYVCKYGSYTYHGQGPCPQGFYCAGKSIQVCPPRHYCHGHGNAYPTPCPSGTYNPLLGQTACISCPLGSVCPYPKLLVPLPCPRGYICDQEGLIFPIKLCTAGYYCEESVGTALVEPPCYVISLLNALKAGYCGYNILLNTNSPINYSLNITELGSASQNLCCWNSTRTASFISGISAKESFQTAAKTFLANGYIGMNLYTTNTGSGYSLNISAYFSDSDDQRLFKFYLVQLLDVKKPTQCRAGVYCLEGITNDTVNTLSVRSGKLCNPGTYCVAGSSTPGGQLCPPGYHCPSGSSSPVANSPGTSTGFLGNVIDTNCPPNYFSNQNASLFCYNCPDGYECKSTGTVWPTICQVGYYRNHKENSICSECPIGSYSYDYGLLSSYECLACDAGRTCLLAGTYNISLSTPCPQGYVCEEAADASLQNECPAGFLCDSGTSPETQYDLPCESGFYCQAGMKYINKYLFPCPDNTYCPPATYDYSVFYADPSNSNATSYEIPPTQCPSGTGKGSDGIRNSLLNCTMQTIYAEGTPIVKINPIVVEISANFTVYQSNNTEFYAFHLESRQVALITIDLQHVNSYMLTYGTDWIISFTILPSIDNNTQIHPDDMPQSFLRGSVIKESVLEFTILAWDSVDFTVNVLIYNGLFQTHGFLFVNTTAVEIFTANREDYGTRFTYLAQITNAVALPFNIPPSDSIFPNYLLTFAPSPPVANLERVNKTSTNWFQPNTRFWESRSSLFLPYFPYFSNCKGYGQYIPIWTPLELSPECELVEPSLTKIVNAYVFGSSAVADRCEDITIECVYDELIGDTQALPRWFEIPALGNVFYLTESAVSDNDFFNQSFTGLLVPVVAKNAVAVGELPSVVHLEILYQQVNQFTKKIVLIEMSFLNTITLTPDQQNGAAETPYNLTITYKAMNQKQLLVSFVFNYTFYFVLFLLIGIVTVGFGVMIWIYKRIFPFTAPIPKFEFVSILILKIEPTIKGFVLGMIPILAAFTVNSILVIGYLLGSYCLVAGNEPQANNGIFDSILITYKQYPSVTGLKAQQGRLGVSLIAMGTYIVWVSIKMFVLDSPQKLNEDNTGNIWSGTFWRRMNLLFASMIALAFVVAEFQFSFSTIFPLNAFALVPVLIMLSKVLEYNLIEMLNDELIIEPINQGVASMTGIAIFGALDFIVFLIGYFVGLQNILFIRLYAEFAKDWVSEAWQSINEKLIKIGSRIQDINTYKKIFKKIKNFGSISQTDSQNERIQQEIEEIEVLEHYESDQDQVEEENSFYTYDEVLPSPVVPAKEGEELDEQEIESLAKYYIGYSGDLVGYFYNPILTIFCWNYYDYIPIFSIYLIAKKDVLFYVMFMVVMIPFNLILDIVLDNVNSLYNGWAVTDFLLFMKHKFATRKKRWVNEDPQNDKIIEEPLRGIYRVCFTSQFFFMSTIYNAGFCFVSFGFVAILNNPGYNAFDDRATIPIILFSIGMCYVIYIITVIAGNLLKIWKIDEKNQEIDENYKNEEEEEKKNVNFMELYNEIYNPSSQEKIIPKINNWYKVELVKADDEIIRRELNTAKITSPEIREKFLEINKEWLQNNLMNVFSDENFDEHKGIMLTKLAKLYGYLTQTTENRIFPELLTEKNERISKNSIISIAKYWLSRARRNRKLFMQISEVIQKKIQKECLYCGSLYTLQCELIENIEELFFSFKKNTRYALRYKMFTWDLFEWKKFVSKNGHFRTICIECLCKCEEFNKNAAQTNPRSIVPIQEEDNENALAETTIQIANKWVGLARDILENRHKSK